MGTRDRGMKHGSTDGKWSEKRETMARYYHARLYKAKLLGGTEWRTM
jgi:hypothetical protein